MVALPTGAWAGAHRRTLRHGDKPILALTQGKHRNYVYPLFTPQGLRGDVGASGGPSAPQLVLVRGGPSSTAACRSTHGKGLRGLHLQPLSQRDLPGPRAGPHRRDAPTTGAAEGDAFRITQTLDWRGPAEWAAPDGRLAARETRTLRVARQRDAHVIDVESRLAAVDWDFTLGPTRHAYFNVRVADSMIVGLGGVVRDDKGRSGGEAVSGADARWIDFSGPVGGGQVAGIAVFPDPRDHADISWFVADWGVVTVGPFRLKQALVRRGEHLRARYRVLVHDGDAGCGECRGGVTRQFLQTTG